MGRILGVLACLGVLLGGCYSPPHPACGFICGTGGACPADYACAHDNYCHLNGSPASLVCMVDAGIPDALDAYLVPPQVVSTTPVADATGVARDSTIMVFFDQHVANINPSTFLVHAGASAITGNVQFDGFATATFTPIGLYPPGTRIQVDLTSGIASTLGAPLAAYAFGFVTLDDVAPTLASSTPMAGDTAVPVGSTIVVTFSEIVANVGTTSFTVAQGATPITGTIATADNITFTFTPTANLPAASVITVNLSAAITDPSGNPLAPVQLTFTTQ